jgi:hypothetical protein
MSRMLDRAYREVVEAGGKPLGEPNDEPHGNWEFLLTGPSREVVGIATNLGQSE